MNVYASQLRREPGYFSVIQLRPPLSGFLTYAVFSLIFTAVVLTVGRIFLIRLENPGTSVEAAVALLLVGPTLLAAYVSRPGEHILVARTLRWIRYLVSLSALLPYVGAATLVLRTDSLLAAHIWVGLSVLSWALACSLGAIVYRCKIDLDRAQNAADETEEYELTAFNIM